MKALTRNIDRLALGDRKKTELLTPHELYRKAHPGLAPNNMDVTDPREWYSTSAKKRVLKKLAPSQQSLSQGTTTIATKTASTTTSVSAPHGNPTADEQAASAANQVAFYVSFPNIRQASDVAEASRARAHAKQTNDHNNKLLPEIKTHSSDVSRADDSQRRRKDSKNSESKMQMQHFIPHLESDSSARSAHNNAHSSRLRENTSLTRDVTNDAITDRYGNVYYKYHKKSAVSPQRHTTPQDQTTPQQEKTPNHVNNIEIQIPAVSTHSARVTRHSTDAASLTSSAKNNEPSKNGGRALNHNKGEDI